jgi:hypothetical protein
MASLQVRRFYLPIITLPLCIRVTALHNNFPIYTLANFGCILIVFQLRMACHLVGDVTQTFVIDGFDETYLLSKLVVPYIIIL